MSAPEQTDDRDALTRLEEELLQIKARVNGVPTTRPRCPARPDGAAALCGHYADTKMEEARQRPGPRHICLFFRGFLVSPPGFEPGTY